MDEWEISGRRGWLFFVYMDDEGEIHVARDNRKWDGKARFIGYTRLNVLDHRGDEISPSELYGRIK